MQLKNGERARLGRSGPHPRGPLRGGVSQNLLVPARALGFGARARRTTAGAAVLPIRFNRIVPVKRSAGCEVPVQRVGA